MNGMPILISTLRLPNIFRILKLPLYKILFLINWSKQTIERSQNGFSGLLFHSYLPCLLTHSSHLVLQLCLWHHFPLITLDHPHFSESSPHPSLSNPFPPASFSSESFPAFSSPELIKRFNSLTLSLLRIQITSKFLMLAGLKMDLRAIVPESN